MKHRTKQFLKSTLNASILTAAIGTLGKLSGKRISKGARLGLFIGAIGAQSLITPAFAMSQSDISSYAAAMRSAANNQNIAQISKLISDDAIIALSRNNKTTSLDKEGYLQLLQKNWAKASDYQYNIEISDVVISGSQARAQVHTTESWSENGKRITIKTSAKATLSQNGKDAVLLRSVAQVTVN